VLIPSRSGLWPAGRQRAARVLWCAVLAVVLCGVGLARAAAPDTSGLGFSPQPGTSLPLAAVLREADGREIALRQVVGDRPVLVALGYFACPALCGVVRDDLFAALAGSGLVAGRDYTLLFVSIDPAEGPAASAKALRDDLARYPLPGAAEGWHFLTGDAAAVEAVEESVGYRSRFDGALKQFLHPAGVVVATPGGVVSGALMGVGYQAGDLRAAVVEARDGGLEQAIQPVLLLCFHYDAVTGRYSLEVLKVLRLGAVLTIALIAGTFGLLRWREGRG
jgi:protein SCO1/2